MIRVVSNDKIYLVKYNVTKNYETRLQKICVGGGNKLKYVMNQAYLKYYYNENSRLSELLFIKNEHDS